MSEDERDIYRSARETLAEHAKDLDEEYWLLEMLGLM